MKPFRHFYPMSAKGKGVNYALAGAAPTTFSWVAALEDLDDTPTPISRYMIRIDRRSKDILPPELIVLSESELAEAILAATGQHLASSSRFTDGALSISYKVTVQENQPDDDGAYVVQLRHHGCVASMGALMGLISRTVDPRLLPVPPVYPIPGERQRQEVTGMGRQITRPIPGIVASSVYPQLSHENKLAPPQLANSSPKKSTARSSSPSDPDRHHNLGGPFTSVRAYLQAHIRSSLSALEKQQGIDEYKSRFLHRLQHFVAHRLPTAIPVAVEAVPVVALHANMGPHNVIVASEAAPAEIRAVIDWEFVGSAPYASVYRVIEMLFRKQAANGFGAEYDRGDELRGAFWGAIPEWELWERSEATRAFLEWFRFGLFMKPEWRPRELSEEEREGYWRENIRVVEGVLGKYS